MKDVSWGDFLFALVLAPLLVLPVLAIVYVALFVVLDVGAGVSSHWLQITFVVACVAEGCILSALYEGDGKAIEYGWAWVLVAFLVAAGAFAPYLIGYVSLESAVGLAEYFYTMLAGTFLTIMLSIFINTRRKVPDLLERSKSSLQSDVKTSILRR